MNKGWWCVVPESTLEKNCNSIYLCMGTHGRHEKYKSLKEATEAKDRWNREGILGSKYCVVYIELEPGREWE